MIETCPICHGWGGRYYGGDVYGSGDRADCFTCDGRGWLPVRDDCIEKIGRAGAGLRSLTGGVPARPTPSSIVR